MRLCARFFLLACMAGGVNAADQCPFIRPPGLSAQQVDQAVLATYAEALRTDPATIDKSKTIKSLEGTENAILTYLFAAMTVGERLGFDAIRIFFDAAEAKGGKQPFDTLSVAEMQSLARSEYARGFDSEPPMARAEDLFKVHSISVRSPQPVLGWRLIRCGAEHIAFQRASSSSGSTAAVRVTGLPPYETQAQFLDLVTTQISTTLPRGYVARPWKPLPVDAASTPCADSILLADGTDGRQLLFRSRICYAARDAKFGYAILFAHHGPKGAEPPRAEAEGFVLSVKGY